MKKTTRFFSLVLALLMVLVMVPAFAISADEVAPAITVWDGKVPFTSDAGVTDTDRANWKTLTEVIHNTTKYALTAEQIKNDFDYSAWEIKTADGLALFSAFMNRKVTIDGNPANGNPHSPTWGKTIKLANDIYLNDPTKDQSEWTNLWFPIAGDFQGNNTSSITFDGQGHFVYGMKIDETAHASSLDGYRTHRNIGFFGIIKGTLKVNNLALLSGVIDAENCAPAEGSTEVPTMTVGGLIGASDKLEVNSVIVNVDINVHSTGTGSDTNNVANQKWGVIAGGVVGFDNYWPGSSAASYTDVVYIGDMNATKEGEGNAIGSGISGIAYDNGAKALQIKAMKNILVDANRTGFGGGRTFHHEYTYDRVKDATVGNVYGVGATWDANAWAAANGWGGTFIGAGITAEEIVSGTNPIADWTKEDGKYPLPAAFEDNYALIDSLIDASANTKTYKAQYPALKAVKAADFLTLKGAAVRLAAPNGLRFTTEAKISAALEANFAAVESGTLIIPTTLLKMLGKDTLDLSVTEALNIKTKVLVPGTDSYTYNAAVVNIPEYVFDADDNEIFGMDLEYTAVSYYGYKLDAEGDMTYVYSAPITRTPVEVANAVYANASLAVKASLTTMFSGSDSFAGNPVSGVGAGTAEDPYLIGNAKHLAETEKWSAMEYVKLNANIDMAGKNYVAPGTFAGTFDGNGYVIMNLSSSGNPINRTDAGTKYGGFVGSLSGTIKNVAFTGMKVNAIANVSGQTQTGMLAGVTMKDATVENVFIEGEGTVTMDGVTSNDVRFGTVTGYIDNKSVFKNVVQNVKINANSIYRVAGSHTASEISNVYIVLKPGSQTGNNWINGGLYGNTTGFYCTGAVGSASPYGSVQTYAQLGNPAFYEGKTEPVVEADFYGDALGYSADEWLTFANCTPIQKVFWDNASIIIAAITDAEVEIPVKPSAPEVPSAPSGVGAGTEEDPYLIGTAEHLADTATWSTKAFVKLTANIDMTGKDYTSPDFAGVFDGAGFVVSNLTSTGTIAYYNDSAASAHNGGFFAILTGTVKNLALKNIVFNGTREANFATSSERHTGLIAGVFSKTKDVNPLIENVWVEGTVNVIGDNNNTRIGLFTGYNLTTGQIKNSAGIITYNNVANKYVNGAGGNAAQIDGGYVIHLNAPAANGWVHGDFAGGIQNWTVKEGSVADQYGTAITVSADLWNTYEDFVPVQKVFAANIAVITGAEVDEEPEPPASGVGEGTEEDPYLIGTAEHLADTATWSAKAFVKLTANIDMTGKDYASPDFAGVFDGAGFVVSNLTSTGTIQHFTDTTVLRQGGFVATLSGTIKNVAFVNLVYNGTVNLTNAATAEGNNPNQRHTGLLTGCLVAGANIDTVYVAGTVNVLGNDGKEVNVGALSGYISVAGNTKNTAAVLTAVDASKVFKYGFGSHVTPTIEGGYSMVTVDTYSNSWVGSGFGGGATNYTLAEGDLTAYYGSAITNLSADEWITNASYLPVQKAFEANIALILPAAE